jgi:hypothetical protein
LKERKECEQGVRRHTKMTHERKKRRKYKRRGEAHETENRTKISAMFWDMTP